MSALDSFVEKAEAMELHGEPQADWWLHDLDQELRTQLSPHCLLLHYLLKDPVETIYALACAELTDDPWSTARNLGLMARDCPRELRDFDFKACYRDLTGSSIPKENSSVVEPLSELDLKDRYYHIRHDGHFSIHQP